jgi:hypothetical protein
MTELRDENGRPVGTALTAVAASGLAAVAVLALVGVLILAFGHRASRVGSGETVADPGTAAKPPGAPAAGSSPDGAATRASEGTASESAADGAAAVPPTGPPTGPPTAPAGTRVVVLNATDRQGLAARFQRALEAKGWTVVATGNFRGNIPATTVYYPQGQRAAAEALDAQFAEVNRVRPAFSGISQARLTVILTGDFPP